MDEIKVLIVEDEALSAMCLQMELEFHSFTVLEIVACQERAMQVFHEEKPDIVLMDIGLSRGSNGIGVAKLMQKAAPEIPIIFTTGYEDEEMKMEALSVKPLAYYVKPLKINEIIVKIKNYFKID